MKDWKVSSTKKMPKMSYLNIGIDIELEFLA